MLGAMYYPQAPKEPNGCIQSLVISRLIIGILLIPLVIIIGAIIYLLVLLWALSIHPLLALALIGVGVFALIAVVKWESKRISREIPPDDQR